MPTQTIPSATTTTDQPHVLLQDLKNIVDEAEGLSSQSGPMTDAHRERLDALKMRYEELQYRLSDYYAAAKERLNAGVRKTNEAVHSHPYATMAVALGLGLAVGYLLSSRRRA